jgi:hypothetical protein
MSERRRGAWKHGRQDMPVYSVSMASLNTSDWEFQVFALSSIDIFLLVCHQKLIAHSAVNLGNTVYRQKRVVSWVTTKFFATSQSTIALASTLRSIICKAMDLNKRLRNARFNTSYTATGQLVSSPSSHGL